LFKATFDIREFGPDQDSHDTIGRRCRAMPKCWLVGAITAGRLLA
jgi:hypothetical protein